MVGFIKESPIEFIEINIQIYFINEPNKAIFIFNVILLKV